MRVVIYMKSSHYWITLYKKTTEIVSDEKSKRRQNDINVKQKTKKPYIPVQLVSPRKPLLPLKHKIVCHTDEISPPCNSTCLGLEAKEWLRNHPPYITRNLEKELHSNKPIHRKIIAMEKVKTPTKSNPSTPSKLNKTKPLIQSLETITDASPLSPAQLSLNERLKLLENVPATPLRARWLRMLNEIPQASKISCNSQFNDLMSEISTNKSTQVEEPNSSTSTKINGNEESELLPTPSVSNETDNNEPEELSLPTATNFINKIIHNEIIHGDKPTESQNWVNEDILVLDTQPDDYDVLNDTTNAEIEIPESQLNNTSNLQEQEIVQTSPLSEADVIPNMPTSSLRINRKPSFPVKRNITNGTYQIIVPLTDFPFCPYEDCNDRYFEQTFTKCINKIKYHLKHKHKTEALNTEYWCALCGNFMTRNPKLHSCFRHV